MSSGLFKRDIVWALTKCWHGLEIIKKAISCEMLRSDSDSPFNFTVEKHPITVNGNTLEDKVVLVDSDGFPLSVMGDGYGIVQPRSFVDIVESSFEGIPSDIVSALSLYNRKKLVLCVELSGDVFDVRDGDKIKNRIVFVSGFDGKDHLSYFDSLVVPICANTLAAAWGTRGKLYDGERHTRFIENRLPRFAENLNSMLEDRKVVQSALLSLNATSLTLGDADRVIAGFLNSPSTNAKNQKDSIVDLFVNGKGTKGETYWDLLNGVTEFYTHNSIGEKVTDRLEKQMLSSEFGTGAKRKGEFFDLLVKGDSIDMESINKLADKGDKILAERAKMELASA